MAGDIQGQSYTINGIKVQFPHRAYPSQLSMMDKIIKGLERGQNCLLESPTGSGKSLALLCSALAWQQYEHEKVAKQNEAEKEKCCTCKCSGTSPLTGSASDYFTSTNQIPPPPSLQTPGKSPMVSDIEDGDFKPDNTRIRNVVNQRGQGPGTPLLTGTPQFSGRPGTSTNPGGWGSEAPPQTPNKSCQCKDQAPQQKKRVPKIYFGTRTHKQIAQIARELGKTSYKHARMTILASREHTCIDPEVSKSSHKGEECKNKLEGPGCRYYDKVRKISHRTIRNCGLDSAWDLEQFVSLCQTSHACPYFGSRSLKEGADIVFCPYNYLVDPLVRQSMEISLKDQIVILDEAHNIEDSSREAASFSINQAKIKEAMTDIDGMIEADIKATEHGELHTMMSSFNELINRNVDHLEGTDYEHASRVWTGPDIVAQLKHTGVGPADIDRLKRCYEAVNEDESETNKRESLDKLRPPTLQALEGLFMVLGYIYKDNLKYLDDYRVAIVRTQIYADVDTNNRWLSKRRGGHRQLVLSYNLHFWCLNPAVAFSDIGDVVRSVILTSGTLSPLNTFQSELAAPFPIQLEANHVITSSQVWVGTISKGPQGTPLLGSYQSSETFAYQDDVGGVVLNVCQTVPYGVLVFLPSYKYLEKLCKRWKTTNVWSRLSDHKVILTEPRSGDKEDFDALIKEYYSVIQLHSDQELESGGVTGAVFFAVCRGKVSEGLDFADNNARAVIAVGIPYPNIKDTQIELKKQYNDQRSATRGLLRGRDWYDIQAYRAVNQALGRCIRHRNDWGALILVDERFAKNPQKYIKGLSKWVRHRVQYFTNYRMAHNSLESFTKDRMENPVQNNVSMMNTTHNLADTTLILPDPVPSSKVKVTEPPQGSAQTTPTVVRETATAGPSNMTTTPARAPNMNTIIIRPLHSQTTPGTSVQTLMIPRSRAATGATPVIIAPGQSLLIPRNLQLSQAGGFFLSQTQTQDNTPIIIQSQVVQNPGVPAPGVVPTTQTVLGDTQISSATGAQANLAHLDASEPVLDFNPLMASTQVTPSSRLSQPGTSGKLSTNQTSQRLMQTPQQNKHTNVKTPQHLKQEHLHQNNPQSHGKQQRHFAKPELKSPSPQQVPPSNLIVQDDTPSKYKFVAGSSVQKISSPAAVVPRSESPNLFDSDDEESDTLFISNQPRNRQTDDDFLGSGVMKQELDTEVTGRKPLFKKPKDIKTTENPDSRKGNFTESHDSITPTSSQNSRRLSRSRLSKSNRPSDTASDHDYTLSVKAEQKFCDLDPDPDFKDTKQSYAVPSVVADMDASDFKEEPSIHEEILNTKRATSRNKRRHSSISRGAKRAKGVEFDEDTEDTAPTKKKKKLQMKCPSCDKKLISLTAYTKESHSPEFVKAMQKRPVAGEMFTVTLTHIESDNICCIEAQEPHLNCHWSAGDRALVQFLGCADCCHGNQLGPSVGAHVVLLRDNHNPRLREGQVWLLPHCLHPA